MSGFGLNLYSYRPDVFDTDTRHLVGLFATQAALAMGRTRQVENLSGRTRQVENLSAALETRKMIGQAVGVLMAPVSDRRGPCLRVPRPGVSGRQHQTARRRERIVDDINKKARATRSK